MHRTSVALALVIALGSAAAAQQQEKWDKNLGEPAPRLFAAGWVGTPVSLDALRKSDTGSGDPAAGGTVARPAGAVGGNTVVLAFWNADVPC